jgi:DNA-binding transcriptional ArsR family regulator
MHEDDIRRVARTFRALGNAVRLKVLLLVSDTKKPLHIKAVAEALNMDYAALYRHVKVLEKMGLLEIYDVGRSRVLALTDHASIEKLIEIALNMM